MVTILCSAKTALAVTNPTINFQARLMNLNGSVVADGSYNVEFKLYSASSGGSALWTEDWFNNASQGISVVNGYLTANLGSITSFAGSAIPWGSPLWLTINIGGTTTGTPVLDGEMSPRLALTSVPAAMALVSSNASSFVSTLGFSTPTSSQTLLLPVGPNSTNYVCYQGDTNCGFAPGTGTSYIDNQTTLQSSANLNIQARSSTVAATIAANGGDILDLQNSTPSTVVAFTSTGVMKVVGAQSADITTFGSGSGTANGITITPGSSGGTGAGGTVTLQGGVGSSTGAGGLLTLQGGTSGTGAAASGGNVQIQGGTANGSGASNGGNIILQGGAAAGTGVKGQIQINGGLLYTTTTFSSGSNATITQSAVDSFSTILATATASGLTFTVPSPTITTSGRVLVVSNAGGTNPFILAGSGTSFTLNTGSSATLVWNGSAWTNAGSDASTLQSGYNNSVGGTGPSGVPFIKLDNTRQGITIQDSDSGLTGNFISFLASTGGAGGTGSQVIGFGVNGSIFVKPTIDGSAVEIQQHNGGTMDSTKDVFSVDTTAATSTVNLGSVSASSGYNGSTVNIVTTGNANGSVNIGSTALGGGALQTIDIGYTATNTGTTNINIGTASPGAGTTLVRGATGLTLQGGAAASLTTTTGALTITSAAAATWSTSAGALTLTSAAAATWSTSSGNLTLQAAGTSTIAVDTAGAGAVNIAAANATSVVIGKNSNNPTIGLNIGNGTLNLGVNNGASVTSTVNIQSSGGTGSTYTTHIGDITTGISNITIGAGSGATSTSKVVLQGTAISETITGSTDTIKTTTNSTTAFVVQNSTPAAVFTIDTSNGRVYIGSSTSGDTTGFLLVLDNKTNSGDPSSVLGALYYNSNSQTFRCNEGQRGWQDCLGVPKPNSRRWAYILWPGAQSVNNSGAGAPTLWPLGLGDDADNSGLNGPTNVAATTTDPTMGNYATSSSVSTNSIFGNLNYNSSANPDFQTYIKLPSVSSLRVWAGLTDQSDATMNASANPAGNYAAFRFDTGAGDANYQCITKDGTTQTIANSGVAPGTTNGHKLEVIVALGATKVEFKIDGAVVCDNTTHLPAASTLMRYDETITRLTTTNVNLYFAWAYIESDK